MKNWSFENLIKLLTPILTLLTVVIGIYQFNLGQRENRRKEILQTDREILSKFKENQNKIYANAMEVISYLVTSDAYNSPEYKKKLTEFDQLYWVGLASVQTNQVESSLDTLRNSLENLKRLHFGKNSIADSIRDILPEQALSVSIAMRASSMDYSLPGGLQGLNADLDKK
jgi:hypothetical protein